MVFLSIDCSTYMEDETNPHQNLGFIMKVVQYLRNTTGSCYSLSYFILRFLSYTVNCLFMDLPRKTHKLCLNYSLVGLDVKFVIVF